MTDDTSLVPKPRRRWRRRLSWMAGVLLVLLVALELFARFYLGLGDPPLYVADPDIEYLLKPSMEYRRFGNRIVVNAYSMRADPVTPRKADLAELRVLVIGDSVIGGGSLVGNSELATTLLQSRLSNALGRRVWVGNVAAGSWGPPNQLAYVRRFGWFDADVVVLVFNSRDYDDVPTYQPMVGVHPQMPDRRPLLAIQEGFTRFLLPRLRSGPPAPSNPWKEKSPRPEHVEQCMDAIVEIVRLARMGGVKKVMTAQHLQIEEHSTPEWPGHAAIAAVSRRLGIEPLQLGPAFAQALSRNQNPYSDVMHPNVLGQQIIADVLFDPICEALEQAVTATRK